MYENTRQASYNTAGSLRVNITRVNPRSTSLRAGSELVERGRLWRKNHEPYALDKSDQRISQWPNLGSV